MQSSAEKVGVLYSGGVDSSVLLAELLALGHLVQPIYVRCGLVWESAELAAAKDFLQAIQVPTLRPLVVLKAAPGPEYVEHWSLTGRNTPDAQTDDAAVFLPRRNALLAGAALRWRQTDVLAFAHLKANPFADATPAFFRSLETRFNRPLAGDSAKASVKIIQPFLGLSKADVLARGRSLPLDLTFSCLSPRRQQACGACNKCAERSQVITTNALCEPLECSR